MRKTQTILRKLILRESLAIGSQSCIQSESYVAQRAFHSESTEQLTVYWMITKVQGPWARCFSHLHVCPNYWASYKMQIQIH